MRNLSSGQNKKLVWHGLLSEKECFSYLLDETASNLDSSAETDCGALD